jgi:hypothetical protein
MPTLSTPPDCARLAFTLELTGRESYPVESHGALDANYDWPPLLERLERLVAG